MASVRTTKSKGKSKPQSGGRNRPAPPAAKARSVARSTPKRREVATTFLPPDEAAPVIQAAENAVKYLKERVEHLERLAGPEMAFYRARNAFNQEHGQRCVIYDDGTQEVVDGWKGELGVHVVVLTTDGESEEVYRGCNISSFLRGFLSNPLPPGVTLTTYAVTGGAA